MADFVEKTGKTVRQALEAAIRELGATAEETEYEVLAQPTKGLLGLFGAKPAKVRVWCKEIPTDIPTVSSDAPIVESTAEAESGTTVAIPDEPSSESAEVSPDLTTESERCDSATALEDGKKFLQDIFVAMKLDVSIESVETKEGYICRLVGKDLGILIGKHGQTLDALQYLANIVANRKVTGERTHLILDVEDYRRRREETLQRLAVRLAEKAYRMRVDVRLEPMNRHERKIIHTALQDNHRVATHSDGEEPYRCVVITPQRLRRI